MQCGCLTSVALLRIRAFGWAMTAAEAGRPIDPAAPHPRTIGWITTSALALGGSNQSLFLIGALFVGQGAISGQGSAAVPLLIVGLLLSLAAAPGWIELVLLSPNRVGGISAVCSDAFRPYSLVLSALTGSCYWWGWVPTCGLTALLSASAIQQWFLPSIPVNAIAIAIVCIFVALNLCGLRAVAAVAIPICLVSTVLGSESFQARQRQSGPLGGRSAARRGRPAYRGLFTGR